MSEIWNFSPSLTHQLNRCLAAASKNEKNKWHREFGHYKFDNNLSYNTSDTNLDKTSKEINIVSPINLCDEVECIEDNNHNVINSTTSETENIEKICEYIETELVARFDHLTEECLKNHKLLRTLAKTLPVATIERLCKYVYETKHVNKEFLRIFFKYFLPSYIHREYNCLTLDLLINGSRIYPWECDILIKEIINDLNIPNKLLQDYIATLNETSKSKFLLLIEELNLSTEVFVHNLFSIHMAYKGCVKTDRIQTLILTLLYESSDSCRTDKQYGRLLLAFLQTAKSMKSEVNYDSLEKIVDVHHSPFRRPCLNILHELMNNQENGEENGEKKFNVTS